MQVLRITKSASRYIEKESKKCCSETGGILIGTLQSPVVVKATRAGRYAKKTFGSYTNDADYDNRILQRAIMHSNGKLKLVGYWHKHPGNMSSPSSIDLATAKAIIGRNEQSDQRPVFFVITNVVNHKVEFHGYSMKANQKNFIQAKAEIIRDKAKEVRKALSLEPVIVQLQEMNFWHDCDFQFHLTKVGYERLKKEVDELTSDGYRVKAYTKDYVYLVIAKEETIVCLPPPEYPLNPPRFFRGDTEIKYNLPIWNSSFRIIDILRILEKQGGHCESHCSQARNKPHKIIKQLKRTIKSLRFNKRKRKFMLRL